MKLTMNERETIINYTEQENTASVYTCSRSLMTKLQKLAKIDEEVMLERKDKVSVTYTLPKSWICIRKPCKRLLTDEQLRIRKQTIAIARAKKNTTKA